MVVSRALVVLVVALWSAVAAGQTHDDRARTGGVPVAVFVVPASGTMSPMRLATLQLTLEDTLERDHRLEVVDIEAALLDRAGQVPAEVVSEARGLLETGEALLLREQPDRALPRLQAAVAQLESLLAFTSKKELARAQFLLGAAHAMRDDRDPAIEAFVALLAWRPEFVADTRIAPGDVLPLFQQAQKRARRLPGGSIQIGSTPDGALAYVDGRFVGFTPTTAEGLPAGRHYVTFKMIGRGRTVQPVEVSSRKEVRVRGSLIDTPGWDELEALVEATAAGLGQVRGPEELAELGRLIGAEQIVVVTAPAAGADGGRYQGFVYDVASRRELASASVAASPEVERLFAQLVRDLYTTIDLAPEPVTATVAADDGDAMPIYRRWWFWGGAAAAVAVAIAIPLLTGDDEPQGPRCPGGSVCGEVIWEF
jgi:tetratricopeptide (TPR) repeat protein